ncbi:unnamed protein product [Rotaria sordida]|uniref:Cytochrome b561 domain-containing protein n=1 Tax=Rotaria sordida TaxID=392033 RepID=A0A813ZG39_9BILA|nr:unnamed protein product [Rotaria sordida]
MASGQTSSLLIDNVQKILSVYVPNYNHDTLNKLLTLMGVKSHGTITFSDNKSHQADFIRIPNDAPVMHVQEFLNRHWFDEPPSLVISITGGAKEYNMKPRLLRAFRRGLLKVARTTGAWIITGGMNTGIMKLVGEIVQINPDRFRPIPLIDGSYPMQREGAAFVAGCFQGVPGMFVFGGRATIDRRLLSDLWFLQASPHDALAAPNSRGCIYPFSYYHLHGIFQFFTYGFIFPIGYFVGRHTVDSPVRRPLHMILQIFGVSLAICGFSFGIHSVRAPSWLHFKHAHAIIGIITFILTIIQFLLGLLGALILRRHSNNIERLSGSSHKSSLEGFTKDTWGGAGAWRIIHCIIGSIVLTLGLVNISLGVFLAVLPLPVWVGWYIYMSLLVIILAVMEIIALVHRRNPSKQGSFKTKERRVDPKGTSQLSLKYYEEPTEQQSSIVIPTPRRDFGRVPLSNLSTLDNNVYRHGNGSDGSILDDMAPLVSNQRQPRPGDVNASASLPEYNRYNDKEYPISTRERNIPGESDDVGYSQEHEQQSLRPVSQQQVEHNLTRIRLQ